MKAQLLMIVLLFSVMSTTAVAQDRSQSTKRELPEHPVFKNLASLEKSVARQNVYLSKITDHQLTLVEEQLLEENSWVSYAKTENSYEFGRRVESTSYYKPDPAGDWVVNRKEFYTYDDGILTSILLQGISEGNIVAEDRTLITYQRSGATGDIVSQTSIEQSRNEGMQDWANLEKTILFFENGKITSGSYYDWETNDWVEYERFTVEEVNGDLIETTSYYDAFTSEWVPDTQVIYPNLTIEQLYERFTEFVDLVDNGSLLTFFTLLPDYTAYQWIDDGESASWIAMDRQLTESSSELEFGATSAVTTSTQTFYETENQWITFYRVLVGYDDELKPTGMSFYSITDETESIELVEILSEEYQYGESNQLAYVLKYGSWFDFTFSKNRSVEHASARSALTWGDLNTSVDPGEKAVSFRLNQAYPNPFNPTTVIPFQLASASNVNIQVYDMLGRRVTTLIDGFRPAGTYTVRFEADELSSGIYLIRMITPGYQETRSVTLIK